MRLGGAARGTFEVLIVGRRQLPHSSTSEPASGGPPVVAASEECRALRGGGEAAPLCPRDSATPAPTARPSSGGARSRTRGRRGGPSSRPRKTEPHRGGRRGAAAAGATRSSQESRGREEWRAPYTGGRRAMPTHPRPPPPSPAPPLKQRRPPMDRPTALLDAVCAAAAAAAVAIAVAKIIGNPGMHCRTGRPVFETPFGGGGGGGRRRAARRWGGGGGGGGGGGHPAAYPCQTASPTVQGE